MVKDLYDLHALDRLFDVAVHNAQVFLLQLEVAARLFADDGARRDHQHQKHDHDGKQHDGFRDHGGDDADKRDHAGDELHERLLEHHLDVIDVVGEAAHDLAVGLAVKIRKRQTLQVVKQVAPDRVGRFPGDFHHDAALNIAEKRRTQIKRAQNQKIAQKHLDLKRGVKALVHQLLDPGAAHNGAKRADHDRNEHGKKQQLVARKVADDAPQRALCILRLFIAAARTAVAGPAVTGAAVPARPAFHLRHYSPTPFVCVFTIS